MATVNINSLHPHPIWQLRIQVRKKANLQFLKILPVFQFSSFPVTPNPPHPHPYKMRLPCLALTAVSCLPALVSATPLHGISTATQAGYATGSAEYATPTSYATEPYKQPTKTHSVIVGGLDATGAPVLRYNPESVTGYIGDVVEFLFLANNHSVTQADFDSPCFPKTGAFNSGFRPNMVSAIIDLPSPAPPPLPSSLSSSSSYIY